MIETGGRGPGIFTRMPFFTAAVKMFSAGNGGRGRRLRRDHRLAPRIPAATEEPNTVANSCRRRGEIPMIPTLA